MHDPIHHTTVSVRTGRTPDPRSERGQAATTVVAVTAALMAVLTVAVASLGGAALDRTRAQSAADAAALASVVAGRPAASRLAERHGATLVHWEDGPGEGEVTVTVRLGDATATARASIAP